MLENNRSFMAYYDDPRQNFVGQRSWTWGNSNAVGRGVSPTSGYPSSIGCLEPSRGSSIGR